MPYCSNGGDTQWRNLHRKLAQVSCIKFSCKFMQVLVQETFTTNMADKANRDAAAAAVAVIAVLAHEKLKSRKRKWNVWIKIKTVAAIDSRPIRAHHSSHVHASFLYGIELCCIQCKKLVQEKSCTRNHVRRSSFLYKSTCTSFLYKFLDCVSPPLVKHG